MRAVYMDYRKLATEMVILGITLIALVWVLKRSSRDAAEDYWKADQIAQAKRLFGDAWKDAMDLG